MDALVITNLFAELLVELNVTEMVRYTAAQFISPSANQVPLQMFGLYYVFFKLLQSSIYHRQYILENGKLVIGRKENMDSYWLECGECFIMADGIHSFKIGFISELDFHIIESKPAKFAYEKYFKSRLDLH